MAAQVYNRFRILLVEKERKEHGRKITYEEITTATGIAASTLSHWARNKIANYNRDTIARLCEFFGCEIGDLLVYEPEPE